jgi:hypothetical protein
MKAIRVREQGAPDVLVLEEVADPSPGPGEVLVGLHAAGVNMIDVQQRSGGYAMPVPFTPGTEGAGEPSALQRRSLEDLDVAAHVAELERRDQSAKRAPDDADARPPRRHGRQCFSSTVTKRSVELPTFSRSCTSGSSGECTRYLVSPSA